MASPRMTEAEIWAFVTDSPTGILTTLRRDGVPVALPVWYACLDRTIYVQARGKKLQRIAHDRARRSSWRPVTGGSTCKAVHFTGTAEIVDLAPDLARRFDVEIGRKYHAMRATGTEMPAATASYYENALRAAVRFTPDARILHWDNAKITGG